MSRTFQILLIILIVGLASLAFGDDAVLLRYRIEPGEVQVYRAGAKFNMRINMTAADAPQKVTTTMTIRCPFSIKGTERRDDGTMLAELRFHGFDMRMDTIQGAEKITFSMDEHGLEGYRNGTKIMGGAWGSPELAQFPDLSTLLDVPFVARFSDRGEILEITNLESLGASFQGADFSQLLDNNVIYPEEPVRPGDTWKRELTQGLSNTGLPGGEATVAGTATYTVLEQLTHRNRPCLKIGVEAAFDNPAPAGPMQFDMTMNGIVFVDIATGAPLDSEITFSQKMAGSVQGASFKMTNTGSITVAYVGGETTLDELGNARATARTPADTTTHAITEPDAGADDLKDLHIPMVTGTKITINGHTYAKGDLFAVGDEEYAVVAFKTTAVKLHRQSDSAVYQLGMDSRGCVTYVKLLGHAAQ